ncbi:4Fe-4S cluster-binding domain-containing protein [Thalassotalea sp. LPB0316]|uniref:4Fe-4S cluster-binding domain-containing protein n=1 Tax=Thalassotalea sp. LPB0316 TaxID=2769490 RepID=UPI00186682C3|nr:4Fe-4S cluster-binding domain-containing protein [Thalassotalea sp. LPB0316]QOL26437.1 4Fe-4S cluster-binding domain-containing protein [Thalassotalea sp. LPB0316]
MFNSTPPQIVFQEVPGEVSLSFCISGCDLGCKNCHSPELWDANYGQPLTKQKYIGYLAQYRQMATCVLFMGGEWQPAILLQYLKLAVDYGFKTCLYTGQDDVCWQLKQQLSYLKVGAYNFKLGGLASKSTNQRFIKLPENQLLNYRFIKE